MLKPKARVIGFDDGFFIPKTKGKTSLIGIVQRTDGRIEGCLSTTVSIDGFDATQKIISAIENSRFKSQIKAVLLSGVNFAGFNIVDIDRLHSALKLPIIVCLRKKPDFEKIFSALKKLSRSTARIKLIKSAGEVHGFSKTYFQCKGISERDAERLIEKLQQNSLMPEPLRLAHIVASAVSCGESTVP